MSLFLLPGTQAQCNNNVMDFDPEDLPTDYNQLLALARMLIATIRDNEAMVLLLRHQIAKLERLAFGRRSEKVTLELAQLRLALGDLEGPSLEESTVGAPVPDAGNDNPVTDKRHGAAPSEKRPATPRPRKPLPDPDEVIVHPVCACPECGGRRLHKVGEDRRRIVERVPAVVKVIEHVRPRMRCRDCDATRQAPPPSLPIERAMVGPAFLAHVAVSKFIDHIPLNRQSQILLRSGVTFSRQTLMNYVAGTARLCAPLADLLGEHTLAGDAFHIDDTPMWVLDRERARTREGRMWCVVRDERPWGGSAPPAVWYAHAASKGDGTISEILGNARGLMHADGDTRYHAAYRWTVADDAGEPVPQLLETGCWSHARRYWWEAWMITKSDAAANVLAIISKLFAVERDHRGCPPAVRLAARQRLAEPLVARLKVWLDWAIGALSSIAPEYKAVVYMTERWDAFRRFLTDGRAELSNNAVERSIRPVVLGRRNYGFMGSDAGGERAAVLYTLLQTARLNGVDPEAWFTDVLTQIADLPVSRLPELLPWVWKREQLARAA